MSKKATVLAKVKAFEVDTGEILGLVDLRGKGSKARSRQNRKGKFGLMYQAECEEDILTSSSLSHFEARLAMYLASQVNWDNEVVMTQARMARAFKVPPSQICRALKTLEAQRIVCLIDRGVYAVNPKYFFKGEDDERSDALVAKGHLFAVPDPD